MLFRSPVVVVAAVVVAAAIVGTVDGGNPAPLVEHRTNHT